MNVIEILLILSLIYCLAYHYTISVRDFRKLYRLAREYEVEKISKANYVSELGLTTKQLKEVPLSFINYYLNKFGFAAKICYDRVDDYRIYRVTASRR